MNKPVMVSNRFKTGFMQQMDSLTNCFETETGLNAPNYLWLDFVWQFCIYYDDKAEMSSLKAH